MVSIPSMRRRAPSLALLALLATAVNRVGASEETLVAVPLVVSGAAGPDPDPVSCAAEFFPADFDRDGTLAPCFRVAAMRDDDVNDGAEEEAQLCSACVDAVGDVLLPRMLAVRMDPTIADAVSASALIRTPPSRAVSKTRKRPAVGRDSSHAVHGVRSPSRPRPGSPFHANSAQ